MSAGAVVATGSGAGMAWYNPAGLALNTRTQFNISASLYAVRHQRVENGLVTFGGTQVLDSEDVSGTEWLIVAPTMVMSTELVPGVTAAFGVFVTETGYQWLEGTFNSQVDDPALGALSFDATFDGNYSRLRYHLGPVVGWAVNSKLRLGFSLMGIYDSQSSNSVVTANLEGPLGPDGRVQIAISEQVKDSPLRWGLEAGVGLQWEILPMLHFGLMLRGPALMLRETPEQRNVATVGIVIPANTFPSQPTQLASATVTVTDQRPPASAGLIRPLELVAGLGWYFDRGWVSLEFEFRHGLENEAARIHLEPVWNVRAGVRYEWTETLIVGAGVFTDRSDQLFGLMDGPLHLYGLSAGLETRTPVRLWRGGELGEGEEEARRPEFLYFGTTFAFRYSVGAADVGSLGFGFDEDCSDENEVLCIEPFAGARKVQHEVSIYVGTSLEF